MPDDVVLRAAKTYQQLMNYRYDFLCGRKGQKKLFSVLFPKDRFHHLVGFQYAHFAVLSNKSAAMQAVLCGAVTDEILRKNHFQHFDRLEAMADLKDMLDHNRFTFWYAENHLVSYTRIKADYFMESNDRYLFVEDQNPVSLFQRKNNTNYKHGSPQYTVLLTTRTEVSSGLAEDIFVADSYQREYDAFHQSTT